MEWISWTEVRDLNTARRGMAGQTGTTSSALAFGGYTGTVYAKTTEDWNGNNWVEVADISASGGFGAGGVSRYYISFSIWWCTSCIYRCN